MNVCSSFYTSCNKNNDLLWNPKLTRMCFTCEARKHSWGWGVICMRASLRSTNRALTFRNVFLLHMRNTFSPVFDSAVSHYFHYTNVFGKGMNLFLLPINSRYILEQTGLFRGCLCGVMVKAMDCGIVVSEFVLQSRYYVYFLTNTLGKGMNPLILPAMG